MMNRISCYPNESDAQSSAAKLLEAGIPAEVQMEKAGGDRSFAVLEVAPENLEMAVAGLSRRAGHGAITCPDCGGAHVLFPNRPEASPTAAFVEMAAEALHLTEKTFFCHSCQYEWAPEQTSQRGS